MFFKYLKYVSYDVVILKFVVGIRIKSVSVSS